ncbi:YbaB/EbfC family nucleoid-associated protein [Candidatus Peribacteria bacterium]|jgi:DNA-binding protein YbaB|nr:YbaB/EbfC family nucleoid-associated protein [Candidatus Peribacteria bacterium]
MDMKQVQELMKLQQQAQKVQAELDNIHIEAESQGFVITLNGQLKAIKVEIEDATLLQDQAKLEAAALEAINKGMKKAQEIAAQKMQGVMGDLGLKLPGM